MNDIYNSSDLSWPNYQKDLLTVLYYTSSREKPEFEEKIIKNLVEACGNLPIISVSQKPLDLGKNICVGDVGLSYLNEWRQIYIGAKEIKTPYIVFAESDFLYPKEYFTFVPPRRGVYRYDNIWVVFKDTEIAGSYRRKSYSEGAQIIDRNLLMEIYEQFLQGKPQWSNAHEGDENEWIIHNMPFEFINGTVPCITFKTGEGVRNRTNVYNKNNEDNRKMELPYWGNINDLRAKYL